MFLKRKQLTDGAVTVGVLPTEISTDGRKFAEPASRVFYDDTGNVQNGTIYTRYAYVLGGDYYEHYENQRAVTAGDIHTVDMYGGFIGRFDADKPLGAEDVIITTWAEQWANFWLVWEIYPETTVNVGLVPTIMYISTGGEDDNAEAAMIYVNDNAGVNALSCDVYLSDDLGVTWFYMGTFANAAVCLDRRMAIPVPNLLGFRIKVIGTKAVGAEDVNIAVHVRRRNLAPRKYVSNMTAPYVNIKG